MEEGEETFYLMCLYACDKNTEHSAGLGRETIVRTNYALSLFPGWKYEVWEKTTLLTAAGSNNNDDELLGQQILNYALVQDSSLRHEQVQFTGNNSIWGSEAETLAFIAAASRQKVSFVEIHVASSWYHIPRLWLLWKWYAPERSVQFHAVWVWSWLAWREIYKFPGTVLKLLFDDKRKQSEQRLAST
jgi:hypothetical protein